MFKRGAGLHVLAATIALSAGVFAAPLCRACSSIAIATVNNGDMVVMRKLSSVFEQQRPDIHASGVAEQNVLRQRVTTHTATMPATST